MRIRIKRIFSGMFSGSSKIRIPVYSLIAYLILLVVSEILLYTGILVLVLLVPFILIYVIESRVLSRFNEVNKNRRTCFYIFIIFYSIIFSVLTLLGDYDVSRYLYALVSTIVNIVLCIVTVCYIQLKKE